MNFIFHSSFDYFFQRLLVGRHSIVNYFSIPEYLIFTSNFRINSFYRTRHYGCCLFENPFDFWEGDLMAFAIKNIFKFGSFRKNRKSFFPYLEPLEERLECATRVWDGSEIPNGTNIPPALGDPTFSSFLNTLANNWSTSVGQPGIPQNGDSLLFPNLSGNPTVLVTPIAGVFGDLSRPDPNGGALPLPISVNVINDLSLDSNGNKASYLPGAVQSLDFVNSIDLFGSGYYIYGRDYPQFGPATATTSPGPTLGFYPTGGASANPLNVQTQINAVYSGNAASFPDNTNSNWFYMPVKIGQNNSDFSFNVANEGSWLVFSNRINGDVEANYTSISNVNNNKVIKRGSGILVFDGRNSYQGVTSVENGVLVVSNDQGLGSPLVNANVEVNGGTLRLSSSDYSQNSIGNIYNGGAQISNRNLVLLGGDGFVPTVGTAGLNLGIPQGSLDGMTALSSAPNQWNGTVTLVANPSATQITGALNPNGDASIGQQFGSTMEINGAIGGSSGLRKWGMGTVELTQANTFTGDVTIFNGFLNAQNNAALGTQSPSSSVKQIVVSQVPANLLDPNNPTPQFGAFTIGDSNIGGQSYVFGAGYQLVIQGGNGPDQNPGLPFTNSQRLEGLGAFQIISPSGNANSAEWQGNVVVRDDASIGGSPGGTLKISGDISLAAADTLEKRGSNTLALSGTNANLQGKILVSSGDLRLTNVASIQNASAINVTQSSVAPPGLSGAGSIQIEGTGLNFTNNITVGSTGFTGLGGIQSIGANSWSGTITIDQTSSFGAAAGSELQILGNITQTANAVNLNSQLIKIGAGTVRINSPTTLTIPVSVQEGTLVLQNSSSLGSNPAGAITVSTSGASGPATLALQGNIAISNRTLNLDGNGVGNQGALRSLSGNNSWAGNITLAGTSLSAGIGVDQGTLAVSGKIDGGSTTLRKEGAGTLLVTGSNNSQAATVVNGGVLVQIGSDNVPVTVQNSSTLMGSGKTGAITVNGGQAGFLVPGIAINTTSILSTGSLDIRSSAAVMAIDLNGQGTSSPVAGSDYDQFKVQGSVSLSGGPVLNLSLNFNPNAVGTKYTIIDNDGADAVIGTFSGLAEGALVTSNNFSYRISYVGGDGNDVTLTAVGVVSTTTISSSDADNASLYGQLITFTASVNGLGGPISSGTVQFFDNGVAIGASVAVAGGTASVNVTNLGVVNSPHVITAAYAGVGVIASSNSTNSIIHNVSRASTSVLVSNPVAVYGTDLPMTFTALVTPQFPGGSPNGQVLFEIDGVLQPLQNINTSSTNAATGARTATFTTSFSTAGTHLIRAEYLGDSNYLASPFSTAYTQTILPTHATSAQIVSSQNPASRFSPITFTATVVSVNPVDGVPIGDVVFLDNGVAISGPVPLVNGVASFQTNNLPGGRRVITAQYLGAPDFSNTFFYSTASASLVQSVGASNNLIIVGANAGGGPQVNVYNRMANTQTAFYAFDTGFRGGVRVAGGDINADGIEDIIVAAGPGGGPNVKVYNGADFSEMRNFFAYAPQFSSGIFVASGDVNGDGYSDIITGAGAGGGPHVQVFSGLDNSIIASYFAYSTAFTGGISVASGDLNADGYSDVITGAGPGGGPHVLGLSGRALVSGQQSALANFFAFDPGVTRGIFVAAGDYDNNGTIDIMVAAGPGGGPHVKVFNSTGTVTIESLFVYPVGFSGGVTIAAVDVNGNGTADIVTAPYTNAPSEIRVFDHRFADDFFAFPEGFTGGAFVG